MYHIKMYKNFKIFSNLIDVSYQLNISNTKIKISSGYVTKIMSKQTEKFNIFVKLM